jgi:serine/threonine protein kinase
MELLKLMLEKDPNKRITAENCLKHSFLSEISAMMAED